MLRTLSYLVVVFPHVRTCGYNYAACSTGYYRPPQGWAQEFLDAIEVAESAETVNLGDEVGSG